MDSPHFLLNIRSHPRDEEDVLWDKINPNIRALKEIVAERMHSPCVQYNQLDKGSYARIFLFSLKDGSRVVGRVALPVREMLKTEAEVASMVLVKGLWRPPFANTPHNPVGAEWILMEYTLGEQMADCFDDLSYTQKCQTATDLADIMASLFSITSSFCGSVLSHESLEFVPPRYNGDSRHVELSAWPFEQTELGRALLGPINDAMYLDYPNRIVATLCGPFSSEREFVEAAAYRGVPATRPPTKPVPSAFEKLLEVYNAVRPAYSGYQQHQFHFDHGDLSAANLLLDPKTGHITGLVDWEMAGFRPPWLAASAAGWFNEDSRRFLMRDSQDGPEGYEDESSEDASVRELFRTSLKMRSEALFDHYWNGVELRAIFRNLSQSYAGMAEIWLIKYEEQEWPERRGMFPFNVDSWVMETMIEWQRNRSIRV